jgi:hypothetical protein
MTSIYDNLITCNLHASMCWTVLFGNHLGSLHCPLDVVRRLHIPYVSDYGELPKMLSYFKNNNMIDEYYFFNRNLVPLKTHIKLHQYIDYCGCFEKQRKLSCEASLADIRGYSSSSYFFKVKEWNTSCDLDFSACHKLVRQGLDGNHPMYIVDNYDGTLNICVLTHSPKPGLPLTCCTVEDITSDMPSDSNRLVKDEHGIRRYATDFVYRVPASYIVELESMDDAMFGVHKDKLADYRERFFEVVETQYERIKHNEITPTKFALSNSICNFDVKCIEREKAFGLYYNNGIPFNVTQNKIDDLLSLYKSEIEEVKYNLVDSGERSTVISKLEAE